MRPGLVFVGLAAVLLVLYFLLKESVGVLGTFLLQASLVIVILAGAVWFRFAKKRSGWLFFRDEDDTDAPDEPKDGDGAGSSSDQSSDKMRKAS